MLYYLYGYLRCIVVLSNSSEILEKEEFISPSLGDMFKHARNLKKISINDAASDLKIRKCFLQSIENERYELLPGGVYTVGFIKLYAKYLDLDQNAVIEQVKELDLFSTPRLSAIGDESSFPSGRYIPTSMIISGGLILLTCAFCAYMLLDRKQSNVSISEILESQQKQQITVEIKEPEQL